VIGTTDYVLTDNNGKPMSEFLPIDLDNCILWLDANQGVTKDASNYVSLWRDMSGKGNNFSQNTGSYQPKFIKNGGDTISNQPTIRFDGVDDYMNSVSGFLYNKIAISTFLVIKVATGIGTMCGQTNDGIITPIGTTNGLGSLTLQTLHFVRINGSVKYTDFLWKNLIYTISSLTYSSTATQGYVNNVSLSTASGGSALSYNGIYLLGASFYTNGCHNADMFLAEFIIYDRILTSVERRRVMLYLNKKYNQKHLIY
jgi:hypothetical protein